MIPLYDDNPSRTTPVVVFALIAACAGIFLHEMSLPTPQVDKFFSDWAVIPKQLFSAFGQESITLISSQFLHGGIWHLLGNLWFLWIFGNNVEDQLGHAKFLIFYLVCGAIAAFTQSIFSPTSMVPLIGASGAIAGVMGAYIVKFPRAKILTLIPIIIIFTTVRIPAAFFLGFWILGQTVYAAMTSAGQPGVAYLAHISGFVAGMLLFKLLPTQSSDHY